MSLSDFQIGGDKKAIDTIQGYLNKVIPKARPNPNGSTEGTRVVRSNDKSSHPGARGDALCVQPAAMLKYLQEDRQRTETALAIEREIARERELRSTAQLELAELKKQTLFST